MQYRLARPLPLLVTGCLAAAVLNGCGGSGAGPSAPPAFTASYASAHFVFNYTPLDTANIAQIASALEGQYPRIVDDLAADGMPAGNVTFYVDHAALIAATQQIVGVVPAFASGLVTAENQIHLMSPNAPAWGPYDRMISNLVHEFAHCVSMHVNPRIANNPRWLWESVAIYEAQQRVDLRTIGYMTQLTPPSFQAMNDLNNTAVYDVGYSVAEFVVGRWGQAGLRALLAANGDTASVFGLTPDDFHREWFAFARARYGL